LYWASLLSAVNGLEMQEQKATNDTQLQGFDHVVIVI
jgi:hypothetical protein